MFYRTVIFLFFLSVLFVAECATTFGPADPNPISPLPNTVAFSWTAIDDAEVYNVEWDFYGSFEFLITTEERFAEYRYAPTGVPINYRVFTRLPNGDMVISDIQSFTVPEITINTGAAVESISPPAVVEMGSGLVFVRWEAFGAAIDSSYSVEVFMDGDWQLFATVPNYDGVQDNQIQLPVPAGLPLFYRVSRGDLSSPSTELVTSAEESPAGFTSPFNALNVQTIPAHEATYVNDTVVTPLGPVDYFVLGETAEGRGFVRYNLASVPSLNLCNFLYARLVFDFDDSNLPTISNSAADGSKIRAFGSLTGSWDESSTTASNAPRATDKSFYLSDAQIVQHVEGPGGSRDGNEVAYANLDRTLTSAADMTTLLFDWRSNPLGNDGLMITAVGSKEATLTLPVPSLEIVSMLELEDRTQKISTVVYFGDSPATSGPDTCDFADCGSTSNTGSVCSFDSAAWADGIRALDTGLLPAGALVVSIDAVIYGGVDSLDTDRLTVSVSGAAIGDKFLSGSSLDCSANTCEQVSALSSPQYPPQAGGWPKFDTAATENNELKIVYEGDICIGAVELLIDFISASGDPNCPSPTPTPTTTPTTTPSVSSTPSTTLSVSQTPTASVSGTVTPSTTRSQSSTNTATATPTPTSSQTSMMTPTNTGTPSSTISSSTTRTATVTPTNTPTSSPSLSPGASPSRTPSNTRTPSPTASHTPSPSTSQSNTPTRSSTPTSTGTGTGTPTVTPTHTPTSTLSASITNSATPSSSATRTPTVTASATPTPTSTRSHTSTRTPSRTPSGTPSTTRSATSTRTASPSSSATRTPTATPSTTVSVSASMTGAATPTPSNTVTPLGTKLPSFQLTGTPTPSAPPVVVPDPSPLPQIFASPIPLPSASRSPSRSRAPSASVAIDLVCSANPSFCEENHDVDVDIVGSGGGTITVPDGDDGVVFVSIPQNTFPDGSIVVVSSPQNVPETDQELSSNVVDISAFTVRGRMVEPVGTVEICLESTSDDSDQCLGFLDTSVEPVEWRCEDKCPKKRGRTFCGETDHFTNFALLLGSVGADECESGASDELIFDEAWKDGVLVASVAVGICCICLVILVLLVLVPGADRLVYGREGMRVRTLRATQMDRSAITELEGLHGEAEELV